MDVLEQEQSSPISAATALALKAQLEARLGSAGFKTASAETERYLREERSLYRGEALGVARPQSIEDVAFIVKACAEAGMPVVPQGGNTGLVGGQVATGGVVLSLERMNRIRAVDPLNGTITVDAGCTLQSVQEAAAAADALFPLSLASEGTCQIGGNIASNAGGTAVLRYGNMRDLVLGIEAVLPDGRVWNGLRGLRKDNSGYDLKHLFIGSEGTLGIVTGAVLKLFPAIRCRVTAFIGCSGPDAALALFQSAKVACGDVLSAFEFLPRFGLEIVTRHSPGKTDPLERPHAYYVLMELSSPNETAGLDERMETFLGEAFESGAIEDATIGASEAQSNALWALREELSWAQRFEGGSIKHDVSVPISRLAEFVKEATRLCEAEMPGIRVCAFGHLGDGNVHFNLSQPVGMDKEAYLGHWGRFNRIVHDLVVAMGGSIAAEHGVGKLKRDELAHYKDEVSLDLMAAVKAALDPRGLLNPGKVIGGRR
ncbi:MAG: FAD-binding oxidoreductase [Beijerinckiaceae bacterium]|nr:FAD-binding oxidoreductase [Beijerinckiaceae bacterium]